MCPIHSKLNQTSSSCVAGVNSTTTTPTSLLSHLFSSCCCKKNASRGWRRPESYLTPYEMDMILTIMEELDRIQKGVDKGNTTTTSSNSSGNNCQNSHRFYQMVCYRWGHEVGTGAPNNSSNNIDASQRCATNGWIAPTPNRRRIAMSYEEFATEGHLLRELLWHLAKSLHETRTFDDPCEMLLRRFRAYYEKKLSAIATATAANSSNKAALWIGGANAVVAAIINDDGNSSAGGGKNKSEANLAGYAPPLSPTVRRALARWRSKTTTGAIYRADAAGYGLAHNSNNSTSTSNKPSSKCASSSSSTNSYSSAMMFSSTSSSTSSTIASSTSTSSSSAYASSTTSTVSSSSSLGQSITAATIITGLETVMEERAARSCSSGSSGNDRAGGNRNKHQLTNAANTRDNSSQQQKGGVLDHELNHGNNKLESQDLATSSSLSAPTRSAASKWLSRVGRRGATSPSSSSQTAMRSSNTLSKRQRRQLHAEVNSLFHHLGTILAQQFHLVITRHDSVDEGAVVDAESDSDESSPMEQQQQPSKHHNQNRQPLHRRVGRRRTAIGLAHVKTQEESVHDREMKVLIWRRFAQMLVAILTDPHRFPAS